MKDIIPIAVIPALLANRLMATGGFKIMAVISLAILNLITATITLLH
jgi:hypothetical protein